MQDAGCRFWMNELSVNQSLTHCQSVTVSQSLTVIQSLSLTHSQIDLRSQLRSMAGSQLADHSQSVSE